MAKLKVGNPMCQMCQELQKNIQIWYRCKLSLTSADISTIRLVSVPQVRLMAKNNGFFKGYTMSTTAIKFFYKKLYLFCYQLCYCVARVAFFSVSALFFVKNEGCCCKDFVSLQTLSFLVSPFSSLNPARLILLCRLTLYSLLTPMLS